jgi:iron complex outermembrane receptor protein
MSSAPLRHEACRRRALSCLLLSWLLAVATAAAAVDPPIIDAPEVAISATRTERSVLDLPGNVTVIDALAIQRSGARTVPDVLRREAGLYVVNTTGNPEGFTVEARGFNNGGGNGCSTLVLVDGRRINENDTGCPDWSYVALEEIERIEVVRGPASVAYGDNAAAGVIHIFTFRPREDGARGAGQLTTGSWGGQSGAARLSGRAGGVMAKAFTGHSDTHGYRDRSGFESDAERLGLGLDLSETGEFWLDGGYDSNLRKRPGTLTEAQVDADRRQANPESFGDFDRERARFVVGSLRLRPAEDVAIRILPYARRRSADARLSGDDGAGGTFDFLTDTDATQSALDAQVEVGFDAFGQRHTFLAGGELRREDTDIQNVFESILFGDTFTDLQLRRETWGAFLQQEVTVREDLFLVLGLRRDGIGYTGSGVFQDAFGLVGVDVDEEHRLWSSTAALTWRFVENASAYASFKRGFRSANLQETVSLFDPAGPLDPQRAESWEIGGKLREGPCTLNVALFWMDVKDEILFDPTTFSNRNLDRVRHRGVELSGSVRPLEWLELYASYTFDDVRIRDGVANAGAIPLTPKHRGAAGAVVFLPYGFEVGVDGLFVGERPLANDLDNDEKNLASYSVYDARIAWRHTLGAVELLLEAAGRNLTDREYSEFGGEATFGGPVGFFPSPGRSYTLGVTVVVRR